MYGFSLLQHCKSHSTLQAPRAKLGGAGCAHRDGARGRFISPLFLRSTLIWKYEAARAERGGLLAGANLSFSLRPCLLQPSFPSPHPQSQTE